jgi:hypothetical protein
MVFFPSHGVGKARAVRMQAERPRPRLAEKGKTLAEPESRSTRADLILVRSSLSAVIRVQ